jgi:hypothetical protein
MATRTEIEWTANFEQALEQATQRELPIYVDFFSPT